MSEIKSRTRIIRAPRDEKNPYFMMCRATAQDGRLSLEATGALAYLLSKPGDWELQPLDLASRGQCGRNRVYRILKELLKAGYIVRTYVRNDAGHIIEVTYEVYEQPFPRFQEMDNQEMDYQEMENGYITEYREEQSTESTEKDSLAHGQGAKPTPKIPPPVDDDPVDELPDIQMVKPKKEKTWPLLDAVKANWQFPRNANGMAMHLTQMLAGRSVTGSWAVSNLLIPAEPDEVEAFAKWWHRRRPGLAMPVTPEKVQLEFETYRTERDEEANRTFHRAPEMQANLLPPVDRIEAVGSFSRFMDTLSQFGRFFKDGVLTWYTSAWRGDELLYLCQHRDVETFLACPALSDGRPDITRGITWEVYCDQHSG